MLDARYWILDEGWTYCFVGQRSYFALRLLSLYGLTARNISGGLLMYEAVKKGRFN